MHRNSTNGLIKVQAYMTGPNLESSQCHSHASNQNFVVFCSGSLLRSSIGVSGGAKSSACNGIASDQCVDDL